LARRVAALGGAALLVSIAAPASAQAAPAVASVTPCVRYVGTNPPAPTLGVVASGFPANAPLSISFAAQPVAAVTADATGAFSTGTSPFTPPVTRKNLETVTLAAQDNAGNTATAQVQFVRLGVIVPHGRFRPSKKVKYRAFGFAPGKRIYLFVRRGGKTRGRFSLGKAKGDCGLLTKKMRFMPLKHYTPGVYEFWYSHSKRYSTKTRIYRYKIRIFPA
jgi:hypothetical protein